MKLIVGLGNIGRTYEKTRHNAGFMAVDNYVFTHDLGSFSSKYKYSAEILESQLTSDKVIFAKPSTFMNRSGEALISIKRYFEVNSATTLLIYDDIDLDFGTIRIRKGGTSGGHNGINSLPKVVRDNSWRIRIGIANAHRSSSDAAKFVLGRFLPEELAELPKVFSITDELIDNYIVDSLRDETISALK